MSIYFQTFISLIYPSYGIIGILNILSWIEFFNTISKQYFLSIYDYLSFDKGIINILIASSLSIIIYFVTLILLDLKYNKIHYKNNDIPKIICEENEEYLKMHEKDIYDEYFLVKNNFEKFPLSILEINKEFEVKSPKDYCNNKKLWKYGEIHKSLVNSNDKYVKTIIENVTFHINQNECFGLLGPNGAGKSTILNMLTGSLSPTFGNMYYDGKNLINISNLFIGYCNQNDTLWKELTIKEHIKFFLELRGYPSKVLDEYANKYILYSKLENHQHKRINQLSGGTKRKLSVLLAICGYPKYIILDEPTAGMDPYTRRFIWNIIKNVKNKSKSSILMTTHSMEEAEALCNRLTILMNGRLSCIGSPEYLTMTYATNYILDIESDNLDHIYNEIFNNENSVFKDIKCKYKKETNNRCKYYIEKKFNISELFKLLENAKINSKINDYILTESSLDDVFLEFVENNNNN